MAAWDRRSPAATAKAQAGAVRRQILDVIGPFSPFWRQRLRELGRTAQEVASADAVRRLPAVGERDVCPDGDPAGAAALVVQAGEQGWALHAEGPRLRKALARRVVSRDAYRAVVEQDTRPTSFTWAGLAMTFPIASTRSDLDVVARCGARLWQVLGLTRADVVVSGLPLLPTAAAQALSLGALGAGSPLLAPGDSPDALAAALRLVPATAVALPAADAAARLEELADAGAAMDAVRTLLLVGAPDPAEREQAAEALERAGVGDGAVLAMHVPDGHRLAWAECRPSAGATGLHTYPDLELLDVVDPATGEDAPAPGELVLSQLAVRGSALLRWRTGDVVDAVESSPCPACGRTVPRVLGTRRGALVRTVNLRSGPAAVDLRAVAAALVGRPDLDDWRVLVAPSCRDGSDQVLVHVIPADGADDAEAAVAVAEAVRATSGHLPTQVVLGDLPQDGVGLGPRLLVR